MKATKSRSGIYVDTSVALRATLEKGTTPALERALSEAGVLITSRLSLVESARALARVRQQRVVPLERVADCARELDILWSRCQLWELTPAVCDLAAHVAPSTPLRTLDALHLATWLIARRRIGELVLLTADERLRAAASAA